MNRAMVALVGWCAVAAVLGGVAGCSSDKTPSQNASSASSVASSAATSATDAAKGNPPPGAATVTIDGQDQNVGGSVVCNTAAGVVQIAIGNATAGIGAQLSDGDAPQVKQVGLGNVGGAVLGYAAGAPSMPGAAGGGRASASKDGNTYDITGTATGIDMANPTQPLSKPFEIKVTCP